MNLWQKAAANLPLTAGQRSFRKLVQSFGISALVLSFNCISQIEQSVLAGNVQIDWSGELRALGLALVVALGHALAKGVTAQGDPQLGQAVDTATAWLNDKAGVGVAAVAAPPAVPPMWNTTTTTTIPAPPPPPATVPNT